MKEFISLQRNFQGYLHHGNMEIKKSIVETHPLCALKRLAIYHEAYHSRLEEALASNFPALKVYLGQEAFHQLSLDYIAAHPSSHRSIRWYGQGLSEYLIQYYDENVHFVAELAQFEWNMSMAYDAADATLFELSQMVKIPAQAWVDMALKMHASVQRMDFNWDVVTLWEAFANHSVFPEVSQNPSPVPWVLWRQEYLNRFYALNADEAWALDAVFKGQSFGDICEGLCQWHDEPDLSLRAASLLKGWIQSGLVIDIVLK